MIASLKILSDATNCCIWRFDLGVALPLFRPVFSALLLLLLEVCVEPCLLLKDKLHLPLEFVVTQLDSLPLEISQEMIASLHLRDIARRTPRAAVR